MKLAVIVGHTSSKPGASAKVPITENEYGWNKDLCRLMIDHSKGISKFKAKRFLRDGVGIKGAYRAARDWGANAAMELHFNSAGPSANGCEMLYGTDASIALADAVQDATVDVLGIKDRGLRDARTYNNQRGLYNLTQMGARPSILTETFFGSNSSDCAIVHRKKKDVAIAQIEAAAGLLMAGEGEDESWQVTASALNVRGGPGTEFDTLNWGPLQRGAMVEVLAWDGRWAKISTDHGVAYVHGDFLG